MEYRKTAQELIDNYQDDFPLIESPYSEIAEKLNASEEEIMSVLSKMMNDDLIGRIGPIYKTHRMGYSLLAACECEDSDLPKVAQIINNYKEVNHNYERENRLNLWFVVTGRDKDRVYEVCREIENICQVKVLCFPMVKPYKIDLSVKEKIDWDLV